MLPNAIRFCVLTTGKTLATRREDAIRFMTAEIKSFRYAVAHRDDTLKVTREVTGAKEDDPRPAFVFDDAIKTGVVQPDFPIPVDKLVWMQQQFVALGQIPKAGGIEAGGRERHPRRGAEADRQLMKRQRCLSEDRCVFLLSSGTAGSVLPYLPSPLGGEGSSRIPTRKDG